MSKYQYDFAIVGAGPAGMSAARTAAEQGLKVVLIDEQNAVGGQIYRSIQRPAPEAESILGADYYRGRYLSERLEHQLIEYRPKTTLWAIDDDGSLCVSCEQRSERIQAEKVLIATGAQERPVPFPGWTLPGVMTCGAAQILLKSSGLTPSQPLVLAGSGPLLLLIAVQLHRAGVAIEAVLDTTPAGRHWAAMRHLMGAVQNLPLLLKGLGLLTELKRSGIKRLTGVSALRASADNAGSLSQIQFSQGGQQQTLACQSLLVHQGVVPNVQLSRALGLEHRWNELQQCWHPVTGDWGESSRCGLFISGDGAGISGAIAAEQSGVLSALEVARQLGKITQQERDRAAQAARAELQRQRAIRPFLDQLYQPAPEFLAPADETLVCRCEEVSAGQLRQMVDQGCRGPNQTKAFCRSGMGPCQGRLCGLTVAQVIAEKRGVSNAEVGYYQLRMPIKPITLGELADLNKID